MTWGTSTSWKQTMTSPALKWASPSAARPHSIPAETVWTSSLWCFSVAREPAGGEGQPLQGRVLTQVPVRPGLTLPDDVPSSDQPEPQPAVQLTLLDPAAGHRNLLLAHGDVEGGQNRGFAWSAGVRGQRSGALWSAASQRRLPRTLWEDSGGSLALSSALSCWISW